jgi:hypothetical protein
MSQLNYYIKVSYDYEIMDDYSNLIKYLNSSDYFNLLIKKNKNKKRNRINGLRVLGEIGSTTIFLKYTPDRKTIELHKNPNKLEKKMEKKCVLCLMYQSDTKISPINLSRSLLWRNYIISANTYPYFKNHMLILTTNHNHGRQGNRGSQIILHQNKNVISDMIDLYILLGQKGTMFFNGLIGNSQYHFHFHMTSENIPIKELLYKKNNLNFDIFNTKKNNKIFIFQQKNKNCLKGIIFYGNKKTIKNEIFKFLKHLTKLGFLYNVLFIENKDKSLSQNITSIIYVRKKLKNKKITDHNMGATSIGGILLTDNKKIKINSKKFIDSVKYYCDLTLVTPTKEMIKNII